VIAWVSWRVSRCGGVTESSGALHSVHASPSATRFSALILGMFVVGGPSVAAPDLPEQALPVKDSPADSHAEARARIAGIEKQLDQLPDRGCGPGADIDV
jgi:hypothetical protein